MRVPKYVVYIGLGLIAVVAWALSGQIGQFVGKSAVERYNSGRFEGALAEAQSEAAAALRKQLPMKVDEITTLQNAISAGPMLLYHFRISARKDELDVASFQQQMATQLRHNVCNVTDMRNVLKLGGSYRYQYIASDGLSLATITINEADC